MSANSTVSNVVAKLNGILNGSQWESTMSSSSAKDVVPFSRAPASGSELAERAKAGSGKIITRNGETDVAPIDGARLDGSRQLDRERIHLLMLEDVRRGLDDIQAGRAFEADAALADLQRRRAAGRPLTKRG